MLAFLLVATAAVRQYGYVRNPHLESVTSGGDASLTAALPRLGSSRASIKAHPAHFDWRNVDGVNYVVADVQQHAPVYCGSCWVHAVVAMLNDRLKIARRAAFPDVMLARQFLINCAPHSSGNGTLAIGFNGCDGGDEKDIYTMLLSHSIPDETCLPYEAKNHTCHARHACTNCLPALDGSGGPPTCFDVPRFASYGVAAWAVLTNFNMSAAERERAMMGEILARGPIVCNIAAIEEFDTGYTDVARAHGGVFVSDTPVTADDINHDVEVAGWGETKDGTKYWIARNSWGTFWGEGGWFRIERGKNTLLMESGCSYAVPTHDELDDYLHGAQGGSMEGLVDLAPSEQWSHVPRASDEPSANFVHRLRARAPLAHAAAANDAGPGSMAVAGVLGLVVALASATALAVRHRKTLASQCLHPVRHVEQRRAIDDDQLLRAAIVSARHDDHL